MIVCIPQSTLLRSRYRRSKCGEEHHIIGVLLEDVLDTFLYETRHFPKLKMFSSKQRQLKERIALICEERSEKAKRLRIKMEKEARFLNFRSWENSIKSSPQEMHGENTY